MPAAVASSANVATTAAAGVVDGGTRETMEEEVGTSTASLPSGRGDERDYLYCRSYRLIQQPECLSYSQPGSTY